MGYIMIIDDIYLVGGFVAILKNMKLNGKDDIPYMMEKQAVFETTNQGSIWEFPKKLLYFV